MKILDLCTVPVRAGFFIDDQAAIGAGAALLLAPSSGQELRARLSDGLDDVKNKLDDVKGRVNDKMSDKVGQYEHHTSNSTS